MSSCTQESIQSSTRCRSSDAPVQRGAACRGSGDAPFETALRASSGTVLGGLRAGLLQGPYGTASAWSGTVRASSGSDSLLGRVVGRDVERDGRAVLPQALKRVVQAVLLVEDVHHEVAEIQQHPAAFRPAFAP